MAQDFFEELQAEFLEESAFLIEQYEESMLELENGEAAASTLAEIFRVAHSIKGGAAAVGFTDLNRFAHVAEDLLAFLRLHPHLIAPDVISLLLQSGDALKHRIHALKYDPSSHWDIDHLQHQLEQKLKSLNMQIGHVSNATSESASTDFSKSLNEGGESLETHDTEDHTNYELLAELQSELAKSDKPGLELVVDEQTKNRESNLKSIPSDNQITTSESSKKLSQTTKGNTQSNNGGSIKIDVNRIDSVLDTVGEIVVLKNQLLHDENIKNANSPRLASIVDQIDKLVRDLYDRSLAMRLTPLKSMFIKIQRIVRDVSLQLGKDVNLVIEGEETEVERTVFELLTDPMVHLVRNALDHGIEQPEARIAKGKSPTAKLIVSAMQQGGSVIIDIIDDGAGINRDKVLEKAIQKNLLPPNRSPDSYSDEEVYQMIFLPGFSTAEKVTDLSGRGVGLDVVKSNLEKARGKLEVFSKRNVGSTFRLRIPLSTAITDGIIVKIGAQSFILPIYSIREIVRITKSEVTSVAKLGAVVKVREQLIPIIDCSKVFAGSSHLFSSKESHQLLLILESSQEQAALPVNEIIGQAQVVVKPAQVGTDVPEVSGAAILGDGQTVLILDPQYLIGMGNAEKTLSEESVA
jgi:two-component system chemotaxis sensor kinase CheA